MRTFNFETGSASIFRLPASSARSCTARYAVIAVALAFATNANAKKPAESDSPTAMRASMDPGEYSPTIGGTSGLFRVVTGDIGAQHTFRLALHSELFKTSDFLVAGDEHTRFTGTLTGTYTPWKYLEFFAAIRSDSNRNTRPPEENRSDPELILALGDLSFGGKFVYRLHPAVAVGANIALQLRNSVGDVAFSGDSTCLNSSLLASFDAEKVSAIPVRIHLNTGFIWDNSEKLHAFGAGYTPQSINVEKFSLGMNQDRIRVAIGIDAQLRRWTKIGVRPIFEINVETATGPADAAFQRFIGNSISQGDFDGRVASSITTGVRVNPVRGLNIDIASDIGLVQPGYGYGPSTPPWNLILGLAYAYDPIPPTRVVKQSCPQCTQPKTTKASKIRGRIIDATSSAPIANAVVTFPGKALTGLSSDPDGGFLSYAFEPGNVMVLVRHEQYHPAKISAKVATGATSEVTVRLKPLPPKNGKLTGLVVDKKNQPVVATLTFSGPQQLTVATAADGTFAAELLGGQYLVRIAAPSYTVATHKLTVSPGTVAKRTFSLTATKNKLVRVTKTRIVLLRKVHFSTGSAKLRPDSEQLLDEVASVLLAAPSIAKVEIQGHTDSRGNPAKNLKLSQARAESVRDYLVSIAKVNGNRLSAKGYGQTMPKRPNLTASGREANRRVEFRILSRSKK